MNQSKIGLVVGSYAEEQNPGIYLVSFDQANGTLVLDSSHSGVKDSSFLTMNRDCTRLYVVSEVDDGKVIAYSIDQKASKIARINEKSTLGGNNNLFPIEADGSLGELSDNVQHEGSSINKQRQEAAHPHATVIDPSNRFVIVPDLGIDQVKTYAFSTEDKAFDLRSHLDTAKGSGPRHLTFHPTLSSYAYLINELHSTINVLEFDEQSGAFKIIQTVATLPEEFNGLSTCADIHITPNGFYLYGSNRGHDSLAMFAIDQTNGLLTSLGHESTRGKTPRNFCIDPSGAYLIAANQDCNNIVVFQIKENGKLDFVNKIEGISKPVCLKVLSTQRIK